VSRAAYTRSASGIDFAPNTMTMGSWEEAGTPGFTAIELTRASPDLVAST
jgi:hypothetical protein